MILKKCLLLAIMFLLLINCLESLNSANSQHNAKKLKGNEFYFFPKGSFSENYDDDEFHRDWYSKRLKSMKEPSLSNPEYKFESAYRFLWLRSFHHPIAVRIQKNNSLLVLNAVELSEQGYKPGKTKKSIKKQLSIDEYNKFCELLADISFWDMGNKKAIINNPDGTITIGADGANWVLEGFSNGKYHVVSQWLPDSDKYKEACLYLIKLAGFNIKPDEIY